jgi:aminoglycoside phosphotransferase (APT) family kinase protein
MLPESERLLIGARRALAGLGQDLPPGAKATLDGIDAALSELLLRSDRAFYRAYHASGCALAEEGLALAKRCGIECEVLPPDNAAIGDAVATDIIWQRIDRMLRALESIVRALAQQPEADDFLRRIVDWENSYHSRHGALGPARPPSAAQHFTRESLQAYLRHKFPAWANLEVRAVRLLPGGFSKRTVLIDIRDDRNGAQSLVMRVEQPPRFGFWDGDQVENEFLVLQMVHEAGLPVPEPLWLETDTRHVGQKFLVSRRAPGSNVGSAVGASAAPSPAIIRDAIRQLVRIHQTRLDPADARLQASHLARWAQYRTMHAYNVAWIEHWLHCIRIKNLRPSPLSVRMMEWLRANVPVCEEAPALLHGDFGLHNILVEGDNVSAVLDWEYLGFGDPAEDIALLWISLGGAMSKDAIMAIYRECGGRAISEYRLRYFDVLYSMKFMVPAENAARLFEDSDEASIGLCRYGFNYVIAGVHDLNEKIARAEAARRAE